MPTARGCLSRSWTTTGGSWPTSAAPTTSPRCSGCTRREGVERLVLEAPGAAAVPAAQPSRHPHPGASHPAERLAGGRRVGDERRARMVGPTDNDPGSVSINSEDVHGLRALLQIANDKSC